MSHLRSHLASAASVIEQYKGEMPLGAFLKKFFAAQKKFGSRDRKTISSLCYQYFRINQAAAGKSIEEKLLIALFIFTDKPHDLLAAHNQTWNEHISLPTKEKVAMAGISNENLFPFNDALSPAIDRDLFNDSMLIQPNLFIRIRPGKERHVNTQLTENNIPYTTIDRQCLALANGTNLDQYLGINKEYVIQDYNSQQVGGLINLIPTKSLLKVWDCCAASGGKSIMAVDLLKDIDLTVSDIRPSIISNLKKRFSEAGLKTYQALVADVTKAGLLKQIMKSQSFDLIICDAPCSGSGTWSRTPEQLSFFKKEAIATYSNLQENIVTNTIPYLSSNGYFLYITCSVFEKENEEVVDFILKNHSLELVKKQTYKGYEQRADSMFAALFKVK